MMADGWIGATARTGLFVLAAALAGCGGGSDPGDVAGASRATEASATSAPATDAPAVTDAQTPVAKRFSDQLLDAVNAARATPRSCGTTAQPAVGTLAWDAQAEQAALAHAEYLQRNNRFSHTGENGSGVGDRLSATGYVWTHAGENIAAGFDDVAGVMRAWIDSPGHCVNLMNPAFTEVAVVLVPGTSANTYRSYWVMVLARPRG